jgi:hypothetical protein
MDFIHSIRLKLLYLRSRVLLFILCPCYSYVLVVPLMYCR